MTHHVLPIRSRGRENSQLMTFDQTKCWKYIQKKIKGAFYERDYAEGRQKTIEELENFFRQGINPSCAKKK